MKFKEKQKNVSIFILVLFFIQTSCATTAPVGMPCADSNVQGQRSEELQKIQQADQADRAWQFDIENGKQPTPAILEKMSKNDLVRRMRVGEIFGEGCFKTAADYKAAFFIYQHGNTSDHYFQAFLWSQKALHLGDVQMKGEVAMAVDRYLVSIGHKQLFGTQTLLPHLQGCWCVQPIEESFPEDLRSEYRGGANAAYTGLAYLKILNHGNSCPVDYCKTNLSSSPQGSVPGFW